MSSLFDTEFQSIESMLGEPERSSYYSNPNNYVNSTWLKNQLKTLFRSKEKYSYYLKCGDALMNEVTALTFSLETFMRSVEGYAKINATASKIIKSNGFRNLSTESQNAVRGLLRHSAENYKYLVGGDANMSTEELAGQKATESKGIKRVFEIIGQAIKRVILAIANFFKGIFIHIRSFFRKFTYSAMQKNFAIAVQAAKQNPNMTVTLNKYSKSGYSKGLAKFLQEIPKKSADIQKNYNDIIKMVTEFANKKTNVIDAAIFQTKLKACGMCVNNVSRSLLAAKIKVTSNGKLQLDKTAQINALIFDGAKGVGKMTVKASAFLKDVQSAGLDKINMDQVLNTISKGMTDLQAKVTEANKAFDKVKANMMAQKNGFVRGLLQFCQSSFQQSLGVCRLAIEFYKISSGVLYQTYVATVKAVVTIAKGGSKTPAPAKGGKKK